MQHYIEFKILLHLSSDANLIRIASDEGGKESAQYASERDKKGWRASERAIGTAERASERVTA